MVRTTTAMRLSALVISLALFASQPAAAAREGRAPLRGTNAQAEVAVVVHPDLAIDELTFTELRKVLLGDRQFWSTGVRVTLLVRAPVALERDVVLNTIYEMGEARFKQYWIGKVFRAHATSGPKIVYSSEMTIQLVAAIPGSISFVDATQVPSGVKILRIDGRLPGEDGYPLR